ncbi:MAG TPA: DUF4342 domain-containing protein [Terriglobia bacterium]|nr:DUF4342 domain-containing protein [Terriglobia bacterium]
MKSLIHEGNIRRIIVKNQTGHTFLEIPLTLATIGVIAAPILAAVGALAALVTDFSIVVEKKEESPKGTESPTAAPLKEREKKSNLAP